MLWQTRLRWGQRFALSPEHAAWNAKRLEQAHALDVPLELLYYGPATVLPASVARCNGSTRAASNPCPLVSWVRPTFYMSVAGTNADIYYHRVSGHAANDSLISCIALDQLDLNFCPAAKLLLH